MSAEKGNTYYLLRGKHGRNKIYEKPEDLLQACLDYFQTILDNPWYKKDWVGKNAREVDRPAVAPFTLTGLYVFIGISRKTWELYCKREDYVPVTTYVEDVIYTQKFEGAAIGVFNANIIARDLGLRDATDVTSKGEKITPKPIDLSNVPLETLLELAKHTRDTETTQ